MYDLIRIYNASTSAYIDVNDDNFYPVERFTWQPEMVGDTHPKLRGAGRHYNFRDVEVMPLEMEGHIKANTTDDYWVARKALLNIVIPDEDQDLPWHGAIHIKLNGDSETYVQLVHLAHAEIPTEALYPTVTPFRFEWDGLNGYWAKLSNAARAKI